MGMNRSRDVVYEFQDKVLIPESRHMDPKGLLVKERIEEIMMMCDREHPIYEQISSFSIALYSIGYFECDDLMSFEDVDECEAADILRQDFTPLKPEDIPPDYNIWESREKYLLVMGDPVFPVHFAVLTDFQSPRPFFSKIPFFGSGFDSLEELKDGFAQTDGVDPDDISYFRKLCYGEKSSYPDRKIYIVKDA